MYTEGAAEQLQESSGEKIYHPCLLLTAMAYACMYSPRKPYHSFLDISKVWLEIQAPECLFLGSKATAVIFRKDGCLLGNNPSSAVIINPSSKSNEHKI